MNSTDDEVEEQYSIQNDTVPQVPSKIVRGNVSSVYMTEGRDDGPPIPGSSVSSDHSSQTIIHWDDGDPENPYNWSTGKKIWIVIIGGFTVLNSTMGSSLPANAIPYIAKYFNIKDPTSKGLPISIYIVGYVVGPLLFGPLSESYGRKPIMISTFFGFTVFTIGCAVAPNWAALVIFRFLTGAFAACPISIIGGIYADIYDNPVSRGRSIAVFVGATSVGPLVSPMISGYISPAAGWRWTFWFAVIFAGISWIPLLFLPETFAPVLLASRAAKLRKSSGDKNIFAAVELEKKGFRQMATVTLTRPIRMLCYEFIVLFTCLYLAAAYGIFYLFFQAYPIIFQGVYHQSPGMCGLMFLPIALGGIIATGLFLYYDHILYHAQQLHKPWTAKEESRRLPLACVGGPLVVLSLFWLGWSASPDVPFWVPMLAGIPFGIGFILVFMAMINYLTDAYEIFAASAMAASGCCRSIVGAVLPFATTNMYRNLGVAWATSLLAFLSLVLCGVPFLFLWKGDRIREGSKFCRYIREKKASDFGESQNEIREEEKRRSD